MLTVLWIYIYRIGVNSLLNLLKALSYIICDIKVHSSSSVCVHGLKYFKVINYYPFSMESMRIDIEQSALFECSRFLPPSVHLLMMRGETSFVENACVQEPFARKKHNCTHAFKSTMHYAVQCKAKKVHTASPLLMRKRYMHRICALSAGPTQKI